MRNSLVFMFSGQGSQYYQMGRIIFDNNRTFKTWMIKLDEIVYGIIGTSIINHMYDEKKSKSEVFNRLLFSHPAIFMVEYSMAKLLMDIGIKPDIVLGSSLGEFTASVIAETCGYEEILKAVIKQAEILEEKCREGFMLAIIDSPDLFINTPILNENSEFVSRNFDSHFVISGEREKLGIILDFLKKREILNQVLPVSFPFHTRLLEPSRSAYQEFLQKMEFKKPVMPYISCLKGKEINEVNYKYYWDVISEKMFFPEAIFENEKKGSFIYLDLGPSGTLSNFVRKNLSVSSKSKAFEIITPFGNELQNLEKIQKYLSNIMF